jgi:flagellar basal body rod protein FlgG
VLTDRGSEYCGNPERMQSVAGGLFETDEKPEDVATPTVLQGMLESSNVQPIICIRLDEI